ncbi:hypothetical protein BSPP4475_08330 [Brevibacillus aydinogluensis]|jgi:hypothetical protein|uniref:Uncharacterized protein n=1 Tax=Brevibacillus aydinogluensis TaxID=927786 RepID=A0AA48M9V7_9BACL|nr:hypothetical protein BSPP4475_08330 [Brevibacillus aydinogluensis]
MIFHFNILITYHRISINQFYEGVISASQMLGGLFFAGSILIYKGRYEAILCKRQDVDFCSTTENVEARG